MLGHFTPLRYTYDAPIKFNPETCRILYEQLPNDCVEHFFKGHLRTPNVELLPSLRAPDASLENVNVETPEFARRARNGTQSIYLQPWSDV